MSQTSWVSYRVKERIATITLNRPDALNAMNRDVLQQLAGCLDQAKADGDADAVVITAVGDKVFSAGADIKFLNRASALQVRELAEMATTVTHKIENLGKVVIAAINGHALGGGLEIAEACMLRVAASGALLGHPEVKIGAVAGFGGTTRLPRLIGKGRAADMLLTGRLVTAEEALSMGLVNRVVPFTRLMDETHALLQDILSQSPQAVKLTWEALHRGLDLPIDASAQLGADYFGLAASTEDFRIGTSAFINKTQASFIGK
ncbi:enoyl-CoA hydratase [Chitinivorax tropicus]|uniref:Enoyl-CoA hydratase n=1 Tax=Chitinivorax tropicus TaxID=714531 RepID=A0A840MMG0_9PROT|nr:enoyl-CoA hydratase-related protein [Chitinivorax tropicus]MBB5018309.1 enoyl-CoA hydratase [Chitinivorax tropicus]